MRRAVVSLTQALGLILLTLCLVFTTRRVYEQPFFTSLPNDIQQHEAPNILPSSTAPDGFPVASDVAASQVDLQSAPSAASEESPASETSGLETVTSNGMAATNTIIGSASDSPDTRTPDSDKTAAISSSSVTATGAAIAPHIPVIECPEKEGSEDLFAQAEAYVRAIMNSSQGDMPRLECPAINLERYSHLVLGGPVPQKPRYFFAINLFQSVGIIPQLLASTVEAIRFLGPENCALSIVEGRSTDGTFEILKVLAQEMEALGVRYFLSCNERNPWGGETDRISALAQLRNQALSPLTKHPGRYDISTTIIFLNDIAPCTEDILELVHQRSVLKADMTCAMDWINDGECFYDSWIARQINGELFFEVPQSGSWEFSKNLFWNHEESRTRYAEGKPVQVFSCWNGAVALTAQPFLEGKLDFRAGREGECYFGEPVHLAKDMWRMGHGRIAIIPKVNVGYSVEASAKAKKLHGWVSKSSGADSGQIFDPTETYGIEWQERPPAQIHCATIGTEPTWKHGYWVPWNQRL